MPVTYHHSTDDPPKPCTWRIVRKLHDAEVWLYCPNGHKMIVQTFGHDHGMVFDMVHRCFQCDFNEWILLDS